MTNSLIRLRKTRTLSIRCTVIRLMRLGMNERELLGLSLRILPERTPLRYRSRRLPPRRVRPAVALERRKSLRVRSHDGSLAFLLNVSFLFFFLLFFPLPRLLPFALFSLFWFFENHLCVILRLCPFLPISLHLRGLLSALPLRKRQASSRRTFPPFYLLYSSLTPFLKWPSGFRGSGTQSRGDLYREGSPKSLNVSALVAGWMHGNRVGGFRLCLPVLLQSRERPASREYVCFMP